MGINRMVKGYFALSSCSRRNARRLLRARLLSFLRFLEVMLLPMYFLIGIWVVRAGVRGDQVLPLHLAGSVVMLLCMLALYFRPSRTPST